MCQIEIASKLSYVEANKISLRVTPNFKFPTETVDFVQRGVRYGTNKGGYW